MNDFSDKEEDRNIFHDWKTENTKTFYSFDFSDFFKWVFFSGFKFSRIFKSLKKLRDRTVNGV